jgi:pimeloyl-ACP methyl ester carboxylesterase
MKLVLKIFFGLVALLLILGGVGCASLHRADIPYQTLRERYAFPESRFVDIGNGTTMHARETGPVDAPVLLMVHGFGDSAHTWDSWTERFSREYRVVNIDLPGHGLTEAAPNYQVSIEHYAADIEGFAAAAGLSKFVIIGSSMGGHVSFTYALAHPERVQGLVLIGAAGWPPEAANRERPLLFQIVGLPVIGPLMRDMDTTAFTRRTLQSAFVDQSFVTDAMVTRFTDLSRGPGHRAIVMDLINRAFTRNYATPEQLAPLAAIPTLILHGEQDNLVPVSYGRQFHEAIAGSELVTWPNVGHLPHEEIAQASGDVLATFLATKAFAPAPELTPAPAAP